MLDFCDVYNAIDKDEGGNFQLYASIIVGCEYDLRVYDYTGSTSRNYKPKKGTPDAVFIDQNDNLIYAEYTTTEKKILASKINSDIKKCIDKINSNESLKGKVKKIIYVHNSKNIDDADYAKICNEIAPIKFDLVGADQLATWIVKKYPQIADRYLNLRDNSILEYNDKKIKKGVEKLVNPIINRILNDSIELINRLEMNPKDEDSIRKQLANNFFDLYSFQKNINFEGNEHDYLLYDLLLLSEYCDDSVYYEDVYKLSKLYNVSNWIDIDYLYANILFNKNKHEESKRVLSKLYDLTSNKKVLSVIFEEMFIDKEYEQIASYYENFNSKIFDDYGLLLAVYLYSKFKLNKMNVDEIACFLEDYPSLLLTNMLISYLYLENNTIKSHFYFKASLKSYSDIDLNSNITIALFDLCCDNQCYEEMAKFLIEKELDGINLAIYIELIARIDNLDLIYIEKLERCAYDKIDTIDKNFVNGLINENRGNISQALDYYKKSCISLKNNFSFRNYILLCLNKNSKIDLSVVSIFCTNNTYTIQYLCHLAYESLYMKKESLDCLLHSWYLNGDSNNLNNIKLQFYSIYINSNVNEPLKKVENNCILTLVDCSEVKIKIMLTNDEIYCEDNSFEDCIIKKNKISTFLYKKVDDIVNINGKNYVIKEIETFYSHFSKIALPELLENNIFEKIDYNPNDPSTLVSKIRDIIEKGNEQNREFLKILGEISNLPLFSALKGNNDFFSYYKLMAKLLTSKTNKLNSGYYSLVDLDRGFVLDISTLSLITLLNCFDIIPSNLRSKIFITRSLKMKIDSFKLYIENEKQPAMSLFTNQNDDKLYSFNMTNDEIFESFRNLFTFIDEINVEDVEFIIEKNETRELLKSIDKCQFDAMKLSDKMSIPFICDEIVISQLATEEYNVKSCNVLCLLIIVSFDYANLLENLINLTRFNYAYSINLDIVKIITKYLDYTINDYEYEYELTKTYITNLIKSDCLKNSYIKFFENIFYMEVKYPQLGLKLKKLKHILLDIVDNNL